MNNVHSSRREFLTGLIGATVSSHSPQTNGVLPKPTPARLPRWRGFNLINKNDVHSLNQPFYEQDFQWISEWGFNCVRLPLDYRIWTDTTDWHTVKDSALAGIDDAIAWGGKYGIHVMINFHRAPGYCINPPAEPKSLWTSGEAQSICAHHWGVFARRYRAEGSRYVSFNLFNEPNDVDPGVYRRVVQRMVEAVRRQDPNRLIIADGRFLADLPPTELEGLGIAAATHCYGPFKLTHYKAGWIPGSEAWPVPTWPLKDGDILYDRAYLKKRYIEPWQKLQNDGMGIVVGEFGVFNQTPHPVALAYLRDFLTLWKEAEWGWTLWNWHGPFGVFDSGRSDVAYENFHGFKLDRKLLDLLRAH